jgi:hypothetical protein
MKEWNELSKHIFDAVEQRNYLIVRNQIIITI